MLSEKEEAFLVYWNAVREKESSVMRKIMGGLPVAVLFCMPILIFLIIVYFFIPEWYAKISGTSAGSIGATLVALVVAVIFYAYFRMHFKWEMNEQYFKELIKRKENQIETK